MFSMSNHLKTVATLAVPAVMLFGLQLGARALSFPVPRVVEAPVALPGGTILPLQLQKTISLKDAQKGQPIEAKIMQEIPFSKDEGIPVRSVVRGSIISVEKDADGPGQKLTLKFDFLEAKKETLPVSAYLRAIASMRAVQKAQTPLTGADTGTPTGWAMTILIGGDRRFGDGGDVRDRAKEKVGKGVRGGGVLLQVRANPALGCEGATNMEDLPQALWVFSSNACGVYDLEGVKIAHTGKGAPVGEITLHFEKDDMKLLAGTAFLLRVASTQPPSKP
jgi:hypothetical protein